MSTELARVGDSAGALAWSRISRYLELTKPRISSLVLVTTAFAFFLASSTASEPATLAVLLHTLAGTGLVAAGANALNQVLEVEPDRCMVRTRGRPLPSGRLSCGEAMLFALACSVGGVVLLGLLVNWLAALVAGVAWATYVLVYTPMKKRTWACVFIGAVSGALPPVLGWSAATGSLPKAAWVLFAIVFFWQLPHFAAIAWLHRADYARAGFPMLSVIDPHGRRFDRHLLLHTVALLGVSLLPAVDGYRGWVYAAAALILGLGFLASGLALRIKKTSEAARWHVLVSVLYLPLLFSFMLLDSAPRG